MKRLIDRGLMFGNLVRVDSPALIERYNRALHRLVGKRTALSEFHLDISGYAYEIGEEFGDHTYLNPGGVNRQFILLSMAQKSAPLLNAKFSMTRAILRRFIDEHEAQLFALTARDAVAGELDNSVFEATTAARLFDIRSIDVVADTTRNDVANARALAAKVERFQDEPNAWWNDALIEEMIALARQTGDVTRQPIDLGRSRYGVGNFWTSHFGGLYLLRNEKAPFVVHVGAEPAGDLPVKHVFGLDQRNAIAASLEVNGMVEPIIKARGVDGAAILRQKMDFILVDAAASAGEPIDGHDPRSLHRLATRMAGRLPGEFLTLGALVRWAVGGGDWPRITSDDPAYFYTLRARPEHPDRDLVNRLLAELAPLDIRQLFIMHKEGFYAAYQGWPEAKREFVADFLEHDYLSGKASARDALFGLAEGASPPRGASPMADPLPPAEPRRGKSAPVAGPWGSSEDMIELVGPWGAVRRD